MKCKECNDERAIEICDGDFIPCPSCNVNHKGTTLLHSLTDFLGDSEGMTTEEIRQELINEGIDIDALTKKCREVIQKWIKENEL